MRNRPRSKATPIRQLLFGPGMPTALSERLKDLTIWIRWEEIVGRDLARCCRPLRLIQGTLTLTVNSAPWMQQLLFMREDIRQAINRTFSDERVTTIVLRQGRLPQNHQTEEVDDREPLPLSDSRRDFIDQQADDLIDQDDQRAFKQLMQRHYTTGRKQ